MASTADVETDVLVVGAGVTGLTLSILLAEHGIRAVTVAKHSGTATSPRAHVTNQRTMEVLRALRLEQEVAELSIRMTEVGSSVLATSLTGLEVARYPCYGAGVDQQSAFTKGSPCSMMNIPQHLLEEVLYRRARELKCDIRFSNEVVDIDESSNGVSAKVRERRSKFEYTIRASYAVAGDGGRSFVAEKFGFKFEGEHGLMNMLTTWMEMDLEKYTAHRPACIYFLLSPGNSYWVGSGTLVIVRRWDEWVLNRQYEAGDDPDTSDEAVIAHARKVLGVPDDLPIKIKSCSKWQVNNVVADNFQQGRVFLAGDAAHRHPPASGLGSNTCVQDAFNIAWKLAYVVKGLASEKLLTSYTQERQPIGKQVVRHAIETLYNMTKVPQTLGFKKGQTLEDGFASLNHMFSDAPDAEARRLELEEVVRLQDRRSNAIGLHLGQRYDGSCAVVSDGTPFPAYKGDPVLCYEPTSHPGAYLPHAFVEKNGKKVSTLDIVPLGAFGLIVGIRGKPWIEAAEKVGQEFGLNLKAYMVGYRSEYDDIFGEWRARREVDDGGAVLVRPDRHIAWRSHSCPSDAVGALRLAMSTVLDRQV